MRNYLPIVLLSAILLQGCFDSDDFSPSEIAKESTISFSMELEKSILADGVSSVQLVLDVVNEAADDTQILFTTTAGSFETNKNDSIKVSPKLIAQEGGIVKLARATLIASAREEKAVVRAFVDEIESPNQVEVTFERAHPTELRINVDSFSIAPGLGSEVNVTVQLLRPRGQPTIGSEIEFSARDTINAAHPVGVFRNAVEFSNAMGQASITFGVEDTTYLGAIKLTATSADTSDVADTIEIFVRK